MSVHYSETPEMAAMNNNNNDDDNDDDDNNNNNNNRDTIKATAPVRKDAVS
jgi:hypothetical protein